MRSGRCQIDLAEKCHGVQQVKGVRFVGESGVQPLRGQWRGMLGLFSLVLREHADSQDRIDGDSPQSAWRFLKDKHARRAGFLLCNVKQAGQGAAWQNLSSKSDQAEQYCPAAMWYAGNVQDGRDRVRDRNWQSKPKRAQMEKKNVSPAGSRLGGLRSKNELKLVPVAGRKRAIK